MIFLDGLPDTLNVSGTEYPINTDFRAVLKYDRCLHMEDEVKGMYEALNTLYAVIPPDIEAAVTAANWFVNCGKGGNRHAPSNRILGVNGKKSFDFEEDDIRLWTAVKTRYGIDLMTVEHLHWWLFRGMVDDIGEDSVLSRIMYYRTVDVSSDELPKKRKDFLSALQRFYAISEYKEERDEEFIQALLNGEDISRFLEAAEE